MAKEVEGKLKLQVPAGQANPSPPVGPALGQRGINIMDFCKVFNEKSKGEQPGVMLPVVVTYNTDKSFSIEIKLPPASFFIKEALKIKKGSKEPGRDMIATISMSQCKDIAEKKLQDLKNCSRSRASDTYAMNINIGAIDRQGILSTDFQISHCMSNWLEQNCAQMKKICTGTFQLSNTPDLLSFYLPESAHRDARFNVDRANMRAGWDLNRNFVCRTVTSDHSDSAN